MSVKRLAQLQWFGLLAGALMLAAGHILGIGLTYAECNVGGARWGIANDPWELALLSFAALVMVLSAAASAAILAQTQGTSYEDDPPLSRIRFFAIAALVANAIYTVIVLLDLFGNVFNAVCRQG